MHSRLEQPARPVAQEIADVNQDRWEAGVVAVVGKRPHGDRRPFSFRSQDFETGLAVALEEQGHAAVVAVCAGADVDAVGEGAGRRGCEGGIVQEAEGGAGGAVGGVVPTGEPVLADLRSGVRMLGV